MTVWTEFELITGWKDQGDCPSFGPAKHCFLDNQRGLHYINEDQARAIIEAKEGSPVLGVFKGAMWGLLLLFILACVAAAAWELWRLL